MSLRPKAEWLEPDGRGGFASGTVSLVRTRRYHALLMPALDPPTSRVVLVNGIEAWVEQAGQRIPLTQQHYGPDVLVPPTVPIEAFTAAPWPRWSFRLGAVTLDFELFAAHDAAGTVLRFTPSAPLSAVLQVRLLLSGRDYHALHRHNHAFDFTPTLGPGGAAFRPYAGLPAIAALGTFTYTHAPEWYFNFRYAAETARGLDDTEDLASPGVFAFPLSAPAVLILRPGDGLSLRPVAHAETLAASERARRRADCTPDCYLADRGTGRTLIAGFPWFTDWGRDSFVALRGLCLTTGRFASARSILLAWASYLDCGMLPNRFPDCSGDLEYTSVDAALWFIVAAHAYLALMPDDAAARGCLHPAILSIIAAYRSGTRHRIGMDADALLAAGTAGLQLTWMDAIAEGQVVTPRIGKPVEVNALWINALAIGAGLDPALATLEAAARDSFAKFHNPEGGLYDVIDADHVAGRTDASIRPNQIFAAGGLPFPVLRGAAARGVVETVQTHLLTPMGLRSLAPSDPRYCPRYQGGPGARDRAYHQGTVWPWLIGAFTEAWLAQQGGVNGAGRRAAATLLGPLAAHRADNLGHIAEIADAEPPHTPRGCPAQAWSLGEFLRAQALCAAAP